MKLWDAYNKALDEETDPTERQEFSDSAELKTVVVEEIIEAIIEAMKETRGEISPDGKIKPLFSCVAFFFIMGIRVGKIIRDAELANQ